MESSSENTAHSPEKSRTLVVMAKAPRPGMVKTRLAQSLPVEAVTELYRCLLDDTMVLARSLGTSLGTVEVAIMCPAADVEELTRLTQRVVAFNSDSPHLPASVLGSAFEALTVHDVVVGPTHDGGYYLVGAKAAHPGLFDGDGMGTKSALEAVLARARGLQLSVGFTLPFYDIDLEGDLTRLAAELRFAPARAPRTAVWLKQWGQVVPESPTPAGDL